MYFVEFAHGATTTLYYHFTSIRIYFLLTVLISVLWFYSSSLGLNILSLKLFLQGTGVASLPQILSIYSYQNSRSYYSFINAVWFSFTKVFVLYVFCSLQACCYYHTTPIRIRGLLNHLTQSLCFSCKDLIILFYVFIVLEAFRPVHQMLSFYSYLNYWSSNSYHSCPVVFFFWCLKVDVLFMF